MPLNDVTPSRSEPSRRFSVAPMMDWTDRHCRYFLRLLSKHTLLYTEMVTTGAILHGDRERFLRYNASEHPLALQLGGSVPADLAACARLAEDAGYDEVNLNVGCPSDRVQNNMIGACLMGHPQLVADCVKAMRDAVSIPVTVKHRIGINGRDSYEALCDFVGQVREAGCGSFTVHARIAILEGLSPKENREIPPLRYDVAARLKQDFPELEIVLNGGIKTLEQCQEHLQTFDGVMLGRAQPVSAGASRPAVVRQHGPGAFPGRGAGAPTALCGRAYCQWRSDASCDPPCAGAGYRVSGSAAVPAVAVGGYSQGAGSAGAAGSGRGVAGGAVIVGSGVSWGGVIVHRQPARFHQRSPLRRKP